MFHQRLVHVLVVMITISLLFVNLAIDTKAGGLTGSANKTILAGLISDKFDSTYEEEELIVETFDSEAEISQTQQNYLDNLGSFKAQTWISLEEEEDDSQVSTIQGGTAIVKPEIAATKITEREREEIVFHKVVSGDSVSTIAQKYGVSVNTVLWENNLSVYSIIREGDELAILPMTGITHKTASGDNLGKLADKYGIDKDKIALANKIKADDVLKIGQKIIIPEGKKITYTAYAPKTYTGFEAIKDIVKAPSAKPVAGNKMNWPTVGSRITQYFSWRHYAIDIANKVGTPLYAADAGTVELAGWGKGYGNQIVIDHGGGKKTRYAHLSKFNVEKGDVVTKGQTIGGMGSTGWSTGSHLHFEIIINGKKYNPLDYIR
ncbi:MAG: Peptidase M23 family protein [Candidatus Falkowbacteria bacterium GW2011_GWC2_38_22]|uniref:Peptidase M23 family protein n=1 Tax=Candidatus Falkowbacteria bacterium GW2011_GWE1_38_31 TaxID=1618638 RepID=A0A0G0JQG3_9BACT|nr:MAG: Peptidase M23 family protein [Candidatus Falkowbacteria bacterium GW2011_GWF2_38_1205]KKQ60898.1 MAG: Peptidase M23 family protein [Candidatus Falkowbacteria bacterium GW2011_GWC2_38_22]KKQ63016.1 MAG: Peptidase M23 family protein [Candidatus Falkowbacteria bacterium GW2011_GWF1_38_22]KKQ65038.1 MAG: Peptidase M23 family protein [Candidatus Falkowbacteria bacterium GW2011_GWE2_38_254]KKQ69813.1 MAG: Peptidase M23 family protein [Candidatus Falkowbacteria bacterium GW2011_GWE1_38_31]KKQ